MKNSDLRILIVEDDQHLCEYLLDFLQEKEVKTVYTCTNARCAYEIMDQHEVDLIFMDLNIEGNIDGIQCAKEITLKHDVLIVFATSYSDDEILQEAIDVNTLNYLIKPYTVKDVDITLNLARYNLGKNSKVLRNKETKMISLAGNCVVDTGARKVFCDEECVELTKKEFDLLTILAMHRNESIENQELLKLVWDNKPIALATLRATVARLRAKLPLVDIEAVYGVGFRLNT